MQIDHITYQMENELITHHGYFEQYSDGSNQFTTLDDEPLIMGTFTWASGWIENEEFNKRLPAWSSRPSVA